MFEYNLYYPAFLVIPCSETGSYVDVWKSSARPCGLLDSLVSVVDIIISDILLC